MHGPIRADVKQGLRCPAPSSGSWRKRDPTADVSSCNFHFNRSVNTGRSIVPCCACCYNSHFLHRIIGTPWNPVFLKFVLMIIFFYFRFFLPSLQVNFLRWNGSLEIGRKFGYVSCHGLQLILENSFMEVESSLVTNIAVVEIQLRRLALFVANVLSFPSSFIGFICLMYRRIDKRYCSGIVPCRLGPNWFYI